MKRTYLSILTAALFMAVLVTACKPTIAAFDNRLGGTDQAAETALFTAITTAQKAEFETAALNITGGPTGTIYNTTGQRLYVDFNYDIDAATVASSFAFYNLADAADNFTVRTRGTALAFTSSVEGTRVYFDINATGASGTIEMEINPATFTGKGTQKIDTDGDGFPGEATDDLYVTQLTVLQNSAAGSTAPTAVVTGIPRDPQNTVSYNLTGLLGGGSQVLDVATYTGANIFSFEVQDTGSSAAPNKVTVSGAVQVYKNVAGVWTAVTSTTALDAADVTGPFYTANVTLATAPVAGESYKVVFDEYSLVESVAVGGYTHRASYEQDTSSSATRYSNYYYSFTNAGGAQQDVTVTAGGTDYKRYIDVSIAGGLAPIDLSTVSAASLKVRLAAGTGLATGTTPEPYFVTYTITALQTATFDTSNTTVRNFRIWMPAEVKSFSAGIDQVEFAPSVMAISHTTTVALQKLNFGNVAGTDGWRIKNF